MAWALVPSQEIYILRACCTESSSFLQVRPFYRQLPSRYSASPDSLENVHLPCAKRQSAVRTRPVQQCRIQRGCHAQLPLPWPTGTLARYRHILCRSWGYLEKPVPHLRAPTRGGPRATSPLATLAQIPLGFPRLKLQPDTGCADAREPCLLTRSGSARPKLRMIADKPCTGDRNHTGVAWRSLRLAPASAVGVALSTCAPRQSRWSDPSIETPQLVRIAPLYPSAPILGYLFAPLAGLLGPGFLRSQAYSAQR